MVILRTRNKITDFLVILAWVSPFKYLWYNFQFFQCGDRLWTSESDDFRRQIQDWAACTTDCDPITHSNAQGRRINVMVTSSLKSSCVNGVLVFPLQSEYNWSLYRVPEVSLLPWLLAVGVDFNDYLHVCGDRHALVRGYTRLSD